MGLCPFRRAAQGPYIRRTWAHRPRIWKPASSHLTVLSRSCIPPPLPARPLRLYSPPLPSCLRSSRPDRIPSRDMGCHPPPLQRLVCGRRLTPQLKVTPLRALGPTHPPRVFLPPSSPHALRSPLTSYFPPPALSCAKPNASLNPSARSMSLPMPLSPSATPLQPRHISPTPKPIARSPIALTPPLPPPTSLSLLTPLLKPDPTSLPSPPSAWTDTRNVRQIALRIPTLWLPLLAPSSPLILFKLTRLTIYHFIARLLRTTILLHHSDTPSTKVSAIPPPHPRTNTTPPDRKSVV